MNTLPPSGALPLRNSAATFDKPAPGVGVDLRATFATAIEAVAAHLGLAGASALPDVPDQSPRSDDQSPIPTAPGAAAPRTDSPLQLLVQPINVVATPERQEAAASNIGPQHVGAAAAPGGSLGDPLTRTNVAHETPDADVTSGSPGQATGGSRDAAVRSRHAKLSSDALPTHVSVPPDAQASHRRVAALPVTGTDADHDAIARGFRTRLSSNLVPATLRTIAVAALQTTTHTAGDAGPSAPIAAPAPPGTSARLAADAPAVETSGRALGLADAGPVRPHALERALGDRLQLQLSQGVERAVIRLDPPSLGSIEIVIRHEAGNLQIHLSTANADVMRQLQLVADSLRQDPVLRQFNDVNVAIAQHGEDGREQQRRHLQSGEDVERPGHALAEADDDRSRQSFEHHLG